MVEENYHGLGIASNILRHLAVLARQKGITQFRAEVLPENKGMLKVFSRSGFQHKQEYSEGVMHVTLTLEGQKP